MGGLTLGTDAGFKEALFNQERRRWAGPGEVVPANTKTYAMMLLQIDEATFNLWESRYLGVVQARYTCADYRQPHPKR